MRGNYNFDNKIDRYHTSSYKWDQSETLFGSRDVLPMWVADMDFQAPPEVVSDLVEKAQHGVYGYTIRTDEYYGAICDWVAGRHGWKIEPDWIATSHGVVPALSILVQILSEPGDKVIVPTPVYYPFYYVTEMNDRQVLRHPLLMAEDGRYCVDYELLERHCSDPSAKLLLLCSPHNPGSRVWTREELERIGEICLRHNVVVVSDEIHGDLVFAPHKHVPFASISEEFAQHSVTCMAPSKTFNLAGLQAAYLVIANESLRRKYLYRLKAQAMHEDNYFGAAALVSAYTKGGPWLDSLLEYLRGNLAVMHEHWAAHAPEVRIIPTEGTYLVWLDCRGISPEPETLKRMMYERAKVAFNDGSSFGPEGAGFLRANIASPRAMVREGVERFAKAVRETLG
jgi:cystathionine beta-lyase